MTRRSPNVLSVGDRVLCRWPRKDLPVVVRGFEGDYVHVEADPPRDDLHSWFALFSDLSSRPT